MDDPVFATPNTRSRRKREHDAAGAAGGSSSGSRPASSQEQDRVVWMHDQRLRRQVQSANEHVELAPPTPTQRPRPLSSSRLSQLGSAASTSSRPPRKRPCRTTRTEPITASTPSASNKLSNKATGSSSGSGGSSGEVKLDQLLQRFELLSTPLSLSGSSRSSTALRDREHINESPAPMTRSALRSTTNTHSQRALSLVPAHNDQAASASPKHHQLHRPRTIGSSAADRDSPLGTVRHKPKPFKTPFLNASSTSATRSSPRNHSHTQSPLRGAAMPRVYTTSNTAKAGANAGPGPGPSMLRPTTDVHAQTPCRGQVRKHNANVDIGEDDPAGDNSFDSFDGLFQDGGDDVMQILKTVDGC